MKTLDLLILRREDNANLVRGKSTLNGLNMNEKKMPEPKKQSHAARWVATAALLCVCLTGFAYLGFTGRLVALPASVTSWAEARVNERIAPVRVKLGGMGFYLTRQWVPRVQLTGVDIYDGAEKHVAALSEAVAIIEGRSLFTGAPRFKNVSMTDAQISLRRELNGQFDVMLGEASQSAGSAGSLVEVLDQIDTAFAAPLLAAVESFAVEDLSVWYTDARSGRAWLVEDGLMTLEQTETDISLQVFFSLLNGTEVPAEVAMSFATAKGSRASRLSVSFSDVAAVDVAAQSPALAVLTAIDAPISGALRSGVDEDGKLTPLSAALEIGEGVLAPVEGIRPIGFNRGSSYFSYDPVANRFEINSLDVDAEGLQMRADGQGFLQDFDNGWPSTLVLQTNFNRIALDPEGLFETPAVFDRGAMDIKIGLDPFAVRIGQLSLVSEDTKTYHARGEVRAQRDGWRVSLDAQLPEIDRDGVLAFWPLTAVPNTRKWISDNVIKGVFTDVNAALRLVPGQSPVISLTHGFRDATVRFMRYMPPAKNGSGYASIVDDVFTLVVEEAQVTPPAGGVLNGGGTVIQIKDLDVRNPTAEIRVQAEGPIPAKLSLLDQRPLFIMSRADLPVTLADGHAVSQTDLKMVLKKRIQTQDVTFTSNATLTDVSSDTLIKGRTLEAEELLLTADNDRIEIAGAGSLDSVPVRAIWGQDIGPGQDGNSEVSARVTLSDVALKAFNIGLPEGSVRGQGFGNLRIELPRGEPARFELSSDLEGLSLGLTDIGWSSPANATGLLEVAGTLGQPANVDRIKLEASGLTVNGSVSLTEGGQLDAATLSSVQLGGWLDAPVVLRGQVEGKPPIVALEGGVVDLRRLPDRQGAGQSANGGPVQVSLDRVQVSEKIFATAVRGDLVPGEALSGQFSARVNGNAPVRIALTPSQYGSAIRIRSDNAGDVLRSAGIFQNSNGGDLDLILEPRERKGFYDGVLRIDGPTRVKGAPVLAELLSALSIIGLVELLDGEGLSFANVEVEFLLTPDALQINRSAATGPSLGISAAGVFDLKQGVMDVQGVISPIYAVNAIGSIFRRGEGLFGFNYTVRGVPDKPNVSVNPLSILSPGLFREIFRRPPPEIKE